MNLIHYRMIQETTTYTCRLCGSATTISHGTNQCGNSQYHCKDCGVYRVMKSRERHPLTTKHHVHVALERVRLRGIEHILGVCRQRVADWMWHLPVMAEATCSFRSQNAVFFEIGYDAPYHA